MSFNSANFSRVGAPIWNSSALEWNYNTTDNLATVESNSSGGYFVSEVNSLRVGDVILTQASDGVNVLYVSLVDPVTPQVTCGPIF
jgi:hypothetical protein